MLRPRPRNSSRVQQLKALLWRQWMLKSRSWFTTTLELLSPIVIIFALVLAYNLVDPEIRPARIRVLETEETVKELQAGVADWAQASVSKECVDLWRSSSAHSPDSATAAQALFPGSSATSNGSSVLNAEEQQLISACLKNATSNLGGLAQLLIKGAQDFIDRNGPIPILTLDEFILLHEVLQAAVEANPGALSLLRNVRSSFGRNLLGNLLDLGQVAFAPATPDVLRFADHMTKAHELFASYFYGVFNTEAEAESYALTASPRLWALVIFEEGPNALGSSYQLRMNFTTVPSASQNVRKHSRGVSRNYKRYWTSGFLSIQSAIEGYSLNLSAANEADLGSFSEAGKASMMYTTWASVFPTAAFTSNQFYDAVGPMLGLVMSLSLIYPLAMLVRGVVEEKETRARETMAIMGLRSYVLPCVWMLSYGLIFLLIAASVTVICCASFFQSTDGTLLFAVLVMFTMSELAFGMMVSSCFANAKIAAIAAPILHFSFLMPRYIFFRTEENEALIGKYTVSLLSPSAFTFAADVFAEYEAGGLGLQWTDIFEDAFPMGAIILMLALDTALYSALAWYLEAVLGPGQRQPLLFPFSASFWHYGNATMPTVRWESELPRNNAESDRQNSAAIQHDTGKVAVQTHILRKEFGKKVAVKSLTFAMHEGEITALLGHNGAGKTSVVGMMTGLLTPTSGDCTIMGHSIVHQTSKARSHLGYCPQQNVLFGRLSVQEHLLIYAAIKGITGGAFGADALTASKSMLKAVGLEDKRDTHAEALSGGMKRKLQVAIALLGDSRVILLDEPTSGVDPVSRRQLWDILSKVKHDRSILLITHYTDEADVLSDRVAIMAEGEMVDIGSALQLKQQFSDGYTLTITMAIENHVTPGAGGLVKLVTQQVPGAYLLRSAAAELVIRLPMSASASFANMLDELDKRGPELGLGHFSIAMPSLEEAFLQANDRAHKPKPQLTSYSAALGTAMTNNSPNTQADSRPRTPERHEEWIVSSSVTAQGRHTSSYADSAASTGESEEAQAAPLGDEEAAEMLDQPEADEEMQLLHSEQTVSVLQSTEPLGEQNHVGVNASAWAAIPGLDRCWTAFVEMLKKRAISAVRDNKAILFALVLPVVAVCLVMLILQVNIDPSAPIRLLDLAVPPQSGPVSSYNLPASLEACNSTGLHSTAASPCRGALAFWDRGHGFNSLDMNYQLLEDITAGLKPQYAALVFNDTILLQLVGATNSSKGRGIPSLQALAAILPTVLTNLPTSTILGGAASQAAFLNLLLSKEARVLRRMQSRFQSSVPVNLLHNATAAHALPSLLSGLHETIGALMAETESTRPRFAAHSHPLPLSIEESVELDSVLMVLAALFMLVPFCLLSGAFCINPVVERMSNAQHMQLLSGCPAAIYWAGSYSWDLATHMIVCLASLAIFAAFGDKATVGSPQQALGSFLALFCYGLSVIPLTYCYSIGFSSPSAAQVAAAALNFVLGFCAVTGSYVMALIPKTQGLQKVLVHGFRVMPPFLLGEGLIELTRFYFEQSLMEAAAQTAAAQNAASSTPSLGGIASSMQGLMLADTPAGPQAAPTGAGMGQAGIVHGSTASVFAWGVLGRPLILMLVEAMALCSLLLLLDQYSRTASLPWPLQRLPETIYWLKGRIGLWLLKVRKSLLRMPHWLARKNSLVEYAAVQQQDMVDGELEMSNVRHNEGRLRGEAETVGWTGHADEQDLETGSTAANLGDKIDELVIAERQRIAAGCAREDTISLQHLRKVYPCHPPKVALDDLCLSIRSGERFGLLGANGAGKTTTLGILTKRILATSGEALVNGINVLNQHPEARTRLGYCPQSDPLIDLMTAREQLAMFARLKGLKRENVGRAVDEVLRRVTIPEEMAQRPAGQYSGGNKRKLALGIALVGGVDAILLDEPSSGMDPGSRRAMWRFITIATEGSPGCEMDSIATILTTHSMEECEALCSRVGLLHRGRLLCLGSPARLKSVYGSGLFLEIISADGKGQQAAIARFVQTELDGVREERHMGRTKFVLPTAGRTLAQTFRCLESVKEQLGIDAYGLSQPTLEQVFLNLVGEQIQT